MHSVGPRPNPASRLPLLSPSFPHLSTPSLAFETEVPLQTPVPPLFDSRRDNDCARACVMRMQREGGEGGGAGIIFGSKAGGGGGGMGLLSPVLHVHLGPPTTLRPARLCPSCYFSCTPRNCCASSCSHLFSRTPENPRLWLTCSTDMPRNPPLLPLLEGAEDGPPCRTHLN